MKKSSVFFWGLRIAVIAAFSVNCAASGPVAHPPAELLPAWDGLNQQILYHYVSIKPPLVALFVADPQGQLTESIDILKGFPGAKQAVVEAVVGGPNGGIVATCRLIYDTGPLKNLILSYDRSGNLTNIIDVDPYEPSALAVDDQGNIFSFAVRTDLDPGDPHTVYPALVKYDSHGNILQTMLPSSSFQSREYPTTQTMRGGKPLLRLTSSGIAVFSPATAQLFLLSMRGEIVAHHDLTNMNANIAHHYGFHRGFVRNSFLDQNGGLVLHMGLDNKPVAGDLPQNVRFQEPVVRVDPSNLAMTEIKEDMRQEQSWLIGVEKDGKSIFHQPQPDGSVRIVRTP